MHIILKQPEEDTLRKAVYQWGIKNQMQILQEEAAELITAISHMQRNRPKAEEEFFEEAADCLICLLQMYMIYKGGITRKFDSKLARLHKRIKACAPAMS